MRRVAGPVRSEAKSPTRKASKLDQPASDGIGKTAANLAMMTTAESSPTTEDDPSSAESSPP